MAGLERLIVAEPFKLENSLLVIPDRPGSGIEWKSDKFQKYRRKGA